MASLGSLVTNTSNKAKQGYPSRYGLPVPLNSQNTPGFGGIVGIPGQTDQPVDEPIYDQPSGGGGGGAYDYAQDPTYQAYISQLDLGLAQQQSDTERRRAQLLGQQDNALYDTAQAGTNSRENISNSYESRGLFNSGGRLRDLSRQQADQGTRESRIRQGTATGISDIEYALAQAQARAALQRQNAGQGVYG